MLDLKQYTSLGAKMRAAQKRYFELSAKARKTKHPDDFKASKDMLVMSKDLERQFDKATDALVASFRDVVVPAAEPSATLVVSELPNTVI